MTRKKIVYWLNRSWALGLFLVVIGCGMGGGGGGDDQVDVGSAAPPSININLTPETIDAGDRTNVRVLLQDVELDAFILKIRYPITMKYVTNSSFAKVGDKTFDIGPDQEKSDENNSYLVYYLTRDLFLEETEGTINLQIEALSSPGAIKVEGDTDIDDPNQDNSTEFDIADPQFDAVDDEPLQVGVGTPTASGTPTTTG